MWERVSVGEMGDSECGRERWEIVSVGVRWEIVSVGDRE